MKERWRRLDWSPEAQPLLEGHVGIGDNALPEERVETGGSSLREP